MQLMQQCLAILFFLLTAWIVLSAGRALLGGLRLADGATLLERSLLAYGLGLGLLAYGMLAIGLAHGLYPAAALVWLLLLALIGGRQHAAMAREFVASVRAVPRPSLPGWGLLLLFLAFALVALTGVYTPPVLLEWDSLSYHLADPNLYIQAHRIVYLPWESHSNFAFTAEMWYTYALLLRSVPLAKLFHFACAVGTCLAIYAFAARHLSAKVGVWAALLFASTPLVFWETGTAYADLAPAFYATLTLLALAQGMAERSERWLLLSAVLMGLTLSTKATALTVLALFAVALLYWRIKNAGQGPRRAVEQTALWCLVALIVGSPWYLKSLVYTGNPIYPFYSHLFGGRYWDAANAAAYDASNASFGMGHRLVDALLVPWNLTMYLLPGHATTFPKPFYDYQTIWAALTPVLLASLFLPAFGHGPKPRVIAALGLYALASLALWFATMQYVRYLLPLLPVLCLLAAWVLVESWNNRWVSGYALAALTACSLAFSLYAGAQLVQLQAPVVFGQVSRDDYIAAHFPGYRAAQFINTELPAGTRVVFYGHPFGFYCDKPYFWGDQGHSTYIPYARVSTVDDLRRALRQKGVTDILIDARNFPRSARPDYTWLVYDLAAESGPPLFTDGSIALFALK